MPPPLKPLIINLDVEPTSRRAPSGAGDEWAAFPECVAFLKARRQNVAEITGRPLHLNWFLRLDYQIEAVYGRPDWALLEFEELLGDLLAAGDGIGIHPHAYRHESSDGWSQEFADEAWITGRVQEWLDIFATAMGFPVEFFRFGDRWLSNSLVELLERRGVAFDLTMEPGRCAVPAPSPDTGRLPDYTMVPRRPFRPSTGDFRSPGRFRRRKIWMLPTTTADSATLGWHDGLQLNLASPAEITWPMLDAALAGCDPISVVLRTGDLSDCMPSFVSNWDYLFAHPLIGRCFTATPHEAVAAYLSPRR